MIGPGRHNGARGPTGRAQCPGKGEVLQRRTVILVAGQVGPCRGRLSSVSLERGAAARPAQAETGPGARR
eukprot:638801-Hanusia_phi.AAC.1